MWENLFIVKVQPDSSCGMEYKRPAAARPDTATLSRVLPCLRSPGRAGRERGGGAGARAARPVQIQAVAEQAEVQVM